MASTLYTTHLLLKFDQLILYVFVKNEVIISWAVSKRSTNTELEPDKERSCDVLQWMVTVFRATEIA